jgi:hypothetical protein
VFWLTGLTSWAQIGIPIDIDRPEDQVLEEVRAGWERVRHIRMGEKPDTVTATMLQDLVQTR